ncbi:hypothetical protein OPU71_13755 [Niveibacterium sp. 24ML]|uniref:hypothetical protein n=1 Tax=Niveibacterium sp. 24ML TaxID=2985512 RepID=UPI00226F271A|nr:hypothetical protein [Niveibacterium sp. 24ML]MCX9157191.1 hypothetical protein [Niveibacterium sp. 24ML]
MDELYDAVFSGADRRLLAAMDQIELVQIASFTEMATRHPVLWKSLATRPRLRAQVCAALGWHAELAGSVFQRGGEAAAVEALLRLGCDRAPSLWRLVPQLCAELRRADVLTRVFASVGVQELRPDGLLLALELQRRGHLPPTAALDDPRRVAAALLAVEAEQGGVPLVLSYESDGSALLTIPRIRWRLMLVRDAPDDACPGVDLATRTLHLDAGLLDCPGGVVPFNRALHTALDWLQGHLVQRQEEAP